MEKKASKGRLPVVIMSIVAVIALIANIACGMFFSAINAFMAANLNTRLPGAKNTEIQSLSLTPDEAEQASRDMAQELESEGIVLLENKENALPLSQGEPINLFGYASVDPVYGGSGSGAGDNTNNVDLIQGLTNAGFTVNQDLVDFYRNSGVSRPESTGFSGADFTPAEVPASQYTDDLMTSARAFSGVAVVVISRTGGEGDDLPQDMYAAGYSDTDDGSHYLELTQDEKDLLELVKAQNFDKVIVLLNTSNAMELGFLEEEGIDAALWIGAPGATGMNAVGQVLSGEVNPSGRLTDTYAYDLTTSPAYWNAGVFNYTNLENRNYFEYAEGIYVGYRFYETRWIDNTTGACDEDSYQAMVQYPFGYGLSYTTFEQSIADFQSDDTNITMDVEVTNTGDVAGKDVVQVYYTAPYTVGGIEKSHVVLAGFGKTSLLDPGASETVTVTFAVEDMASYDYLENGCYVLDAGTYQIKLMGNAHDVIDSRDYTVEDTVIYDESNPRSSDDTAAVNQFDDVTNGQITQYVSRADWEGTLPTARPAEKEAGADTVAQFTQEATYAVDDSDPAITIANHGLTLEDMAGLDYDDPQWESLLEQLSVDDMTNMISNGGWSTPAVDSVGKPATTELDGPAGINSLTSDLKGVRFPAQTIIGATWNVELVERFGQTLGAEAAADHVTGLYAPGANIHRTPFGGRNFEYYSEDGLLSGKLAAAEVRGCMSQGVFTYVKHFALNDQEANRLSLSVWANEQAIRELYLKPFELAVKEGGTTGIMSSYSYLGNTWAGASHALLTSVLRDEWGFRGTVITDSAMGNTSWMDVNLAIRAGGDMMLCLMGVTLDSSSNTAQQAMRRACHNILYTEANSIAVAVAADTSPYWVILLAIVDIIVVSAVVLVLLRKKALKLPVKAGIVAVIAVVGAILCYVLFFATPATAPASDQTDDSAAVTEQASEESADTAADTATAESAEGVVLQMDGTGDGAENAWLGCHLTLNEDGSFLLTWDYNAENSGIEGDRGTWEQGEDGTITMTGTRTFTATTEDGTNYTCSLLNEETGINCTATGAMGAAGGSAAAAALPEGAVMQLNGTGDGEENAWLGCHLTLNEDGSFLLTWDYNAENSGIEGDRGTWEKDEDGTITMTGTRTFTATTEDGTNYTCSLLNEETGINCTATGAMGAASGSAAAAALPEGAVMQLNGTGDGAENAWLACHLTLNEDGSFLLTWDYNAENSGIEGDRGTWEQGEDGTITMTGARTFTATTEDGTNYTCSLLNQETGINCTATGVLQG